MTLPTGRVAVVGPGRVGSVLAAALERAGHEIAAAAGGRPASRERFAARFPAATVHDDPAAGARGADLVVIATPDDRIEEVATALAVADAVHEGQRLVHLAGSRGLAPLRRAHLAGGRVAACHPAQTVPSADADPTVLDGTAWAVTAGDWDLPWATDLVRQVGGTPFPVRDGDRVLYHAALAVASNGAGAAVALARVLLRGASVDEPRAFLAPLVGASVDNVLDAGAGAITGPIARADADTVRAHLEALDRDAPTLADAYRWLARVVLAQVRPALDAEDADRIDALLAADDEEGEQV